MKVIPPEILQNVMEILGYLATAALGWVAKWLSGKKSKNEQNK